ncbi:ParB N-terminal domain-containing protein [Rhizobium sp. CSW-27]|uniref:ParB/RepB/Spo0J family partition protein n=1 Tax=Rhizobium sp. CSW-27 TaxID=2839985 RepID=UPI001C00A3BA|nr:ParB N-terminal domain-containing protein [Rhizobium sp. CSW-27]MBT9373433.1 ParB N-terminal domain-containing protein [Rhizobium sp. CSW-27]
MNNSTRLRLDRILVPDNRLRGLDEERARFIASSIKENGALQPIAVYRSNAASRPYTLIFGLHRYRAHQLLQLDEIDATVRTASEARMLEIAENLFRHDLSELDRATFVKEWFALKGVKVGRPKKSANMAEFLTELGLSEQSAKQIGISGRTARRLCQIADHLSPSLKKRLVGTPTAFNQSLLLKIASMEPQKQLQINTALNLGLDIQAALKAVQPTYRKLDRKASNLNRFLTAWGQMNATEQREALSIIGHGDQETEVEAVVQRVAVGLEQNG